MKRILIFVIFSVVLFVGEASATRLAVCVNKANIRSGPGKNHEILWSVGKYYPLDTLKKSGNWYKIRDFEADEGWIFHSLVKKIPTVIVTAPLVNVRTASGTNSRVLFQAEKGVSFERLGKKGKWFKVRHADGEVGWIHESLVWGY